MPPDRAQLPVPVSPLVLQPSSIAAARPQQECHHRRPPRRPQQIPVRQSLASQLVTGEQFLPQRSIRLRLGRPVPQDHPGRAVHCQPVTDLRDS